MESPSWSVEREPVGGERNGQTRVDDLIDDKAWEHLRITGQEFRHRWYAGQYRHDDRPAVRALDTLMRIGRWEA